MEPLDHFSGANSHGPVAAEKIKKHVKRQEQSRDRGESQSSLFGTRKIQQSVGQRKVPK